MLEQLSSVIGELQIKIVYSKNVVLANDSPLYF